MSISIEFEYRLRSGNVAFISAEGFVYRDENNEAWIDSLNMGFAVSDTPNFENAVTALQVALGAIRIEAENRLVEAYDEQKKEAV